MALACDFSVDSVDTEGPSRLGRHRTDGGGKMGMLTWGTEQGAGSIRVRAMCSCGQGSQLIPSSAYPNQEAQTQNRRIGEGKGAGFVVEGWVHSTKPVSFLYCL